MSQCIKKIIKAVSFLTIALVIFVVCSFIAQPIWTSWNNYNTTHDFYEEPQNTIETIFLGASIVSSGISPMILYEDYGICSYNLGMELQPVMASYYWLEEAYRLHSKTLDTVVFDVGIIRRIQGDDFYPNDAAYHKALDSMELSSIKLHAVKAHSDTFDEFLTNMIPLLSYHERWKELDSVDFNKFEYEPSIYDRGYSYSSSQWINNVNNFAEIQTPLYYFSDSEGEKLLDSESLDYLDKMISFCDENDIKLVLIKTPSTWDSFLHNEFQELADSYNIDFLDFNVEPYLDEVGYNFAADAMAPSNTDSLHPNYYGTRKLTDYLGQYLVDKCDNRDVRENSKYEFMDEELADYNKYITFRQSLSNATDPCEYIETALKDGDNTVFISVKDDAASALTEEQRAYFESIGLNELSQLTYGCSYMAVIDDGNVIAEQYEKDPGERDANDNLISYTGTLHNGTAYTVVSGGYHMGNKSSIIIEDTERSSNKRGLNIAIYDNEMQQYVDNANFDTHDAPERTASFNEQNYDELIDAGTPVSSLTGTDRIMYLYNRECENEKQQSLHDWKRTKKAV